MKFVFASDSFKGTLSSRETAEILGAAADLVFPGCDWTGVSVADGGEGTAEAVTAAVGGSLKSVKVHGPLMEPAKAAYGVLPGGRAVIEMAAASGLPMVPVEKRNPLKTTTFGTGELILDALRTGYRDIAVAIGGSATNDGGMGAMRALGIRFLDKEGRELSGRGEELELVETIDMSGLIPEVTKARFTVMCDVTNPLIGPNGATYTFGKQKGGTPEILDKLEAGMAKYAKKVEEVTGTAVAELSGAGAAGGLGAALLAFLGGKKQSGIETVLDLIGFDEILEGADLVITGEGRMDWQSAFGKVPGGVAARAKKKELPVLALVGGMGEGCERLYEYGIDSIMITPNGPMELSDALADAKRLYMDAAVRMFRIFKIGVSQGQRWDKV